MRPIEFPGCNAIFGADQPEYMPLPAYRSPQGEVTACWQLTDDERAEVARTGQVFVTLLSGSRPLTPHYVAVVGPELAKPAAAAEGEA